MTLKLKVMYNGMELSKYLYVVADGFDRSVIGDRTNTTVKVGHAVGETFLDTTKGMRKITMPFYINKDIPDALEKIAQIVNVEEPKQLIFGDEPDWYYSAIVDGTLSFTRLEREGSGIITWLVPDMYKHAVENTTYSNDGVNKNQILFNNNSNTSTPVTITAKMRSDNGFLGLALNGRAYQVGNPTEVNGVHYDKSEILIPGDMIPNPSTGELNKAGFEVIPPDQGALKMGGNIVMNNDRNMYASGFGDDSFKGPHGPAITYELPVDSFGNKGSKNFEFRWHAGFGNVANDNQKVGQLCATVHDKKGKTLCSIAYNDLTQVKTDFTIRYDINGKKYYEQDIKELPNGFNGHAYVIKSGSQFTFRWNYLKPVTFICDELKDAEACYISFSYLKWMNVPTPAYMGIVNWNFRKNMTNLYRDVPNYFKKGDVVVLDSELNKLTINGFADWDRVDIGSKPLLANVGDNTLGIVTSEWATMPEVTVSYQERRL